jgi:NAD(P) transhydrogenase subunit alpha
MVEAMAPASLVVDLAAERGGNCELTRPDEVVDHHGVTILGPSNPPALVPNHASQMYSKNITTFLAHLLGKDGAAKSALNLDLSDEITRETLLTRDGAVVPARVNDLRGARA